MTGVVESPATSRICLATRLRLVKPPKRPVFRVGQTKYGALNPQQRDAAPDRAKWGRWDTEHGRTVYAGATAVAAFTEVLAYLRENLPTTPLGELFDDLDDANVGRTLADVVRAEFPHPEMNNVVTQGWRHQRTLYELRLPPRGWFVDIHASDSLAAINRAFHPPERPVSDYTLSDLTGHDRGLTSRIAGWVRELILDDGSQPLGLRYPSKHGSDLLAYAVWLRAIDDGKPAASELTRLVSNTAICRDNADLEQATRWLGIDRIW